MSRDRGYRDRSKHGRINLGPFSADTQLLFVDRACSLMPESSYATDRNTHLLTRLGQRPEIDEAIFIEFTKNGPVPSHSMGKLLDHSSPVDIALGLNLPSAGVPFGLSFSSTGVTSGLSPASRSIITDRVASSLRPTVHQMRRAPGPSP